MPPDVLVIGGGIQGTTAALALAERGVASTILEADPTLLGRASSRNEGKIHLGFVYALDPSGGTVAQMVEGALTFAPLLQRWCGQIDWSAIRTEPFAYAVMPDSLASADELQSHYARVIEEIRSRADDLGTDYCGIDLAEVEEVTRGEGSPPGVDSSLDLDWFATPELSVDPRALCALLERAVTDSPLIEVQTSCRVTGVERTESGITLTCDTPAGQSTYTSDAVMNCAWQGRAALDDLAGVEPERLIYRLKHQVIVRPVGGAVTGSEGNSISPLTLVQGPYGDVVPWQGGEVYLSWYPVGRSFIGSSPDASEDPDPAVAEATLEHLQGMIPALDRYEVAGHAPAYIVAPDPSEVGDDISSTASPLHDRSRMGVVSSDGWYSLRSHKLTTAPLVSQRCADQVTGADSKVPTVQGTA